ncbi:uncharacterized protein DFL_004863 [Arthrobotrys flagrans]|uniref:Uncharacterized protein n=1 Tax=Arthrobotrys flagrans TaxID=97331 RepID=A0A437A638_ARTFL|nr:hypothetical protein DFL_004863 [Arthrobotrys flagrans]
MDAAGISKTLDAMMTSPHVIGALIIDSTSGLCLGSRGKATEADATYLTIAARSALKKDSIGAVLHKDSKVLLRKGNNGVLVAIYKDKSAPDDTGSSAATSFASI